jgi:hypothetical protein
MRQPSRDRRSPAGGLEAGQVPRDTPRAATGTATISGLVITDEPQPRAVRRARVSARATELGPNGLTVVTDDRGAFVLTALPAGRYTLSVEKDGWSGFTYGASRPGRPGTSIALSSGQQVTGLAIRMPRSGVITGSAFDQNGHPAVGATVRAMRYRFMGGVRGLAPAGIAAPRTIAASIVFTRSPRAVMLVATTSRGVRSRRRLAITTAADVTRAPGAVGPGGIAGGPGMRAAATQTAPPGRPA